MRQVHVSDPWSSLASDSERELIHDLMARLQSLESRVRELESILEARHAVEEAEQQTLSEAEPVPTG